MQKTISIHAPLYDERLSSFVMSQIRTGISIHTPLHRERPAGTCVTWTTRNFNPRPYIGSDPDILHYRLRCKHISIHALLYEERLSSFVMSQIRTDISIYTLLHGERPAGTCVTWTTWNFNPRPYIRSDSGPFYSLSISIHAPYTGIDTRTSEGIETARLFQSTLPCVGSDGIYVSILFREVFQSTLPCVRSDLSSHDGGK